MIIGKSLNEKQKQVLREMVNFTCENCNKHEDKVGKLEFHRMRRGNKGGKYVPHNLKIICKKCHKAFHEKEF